MRNFILVVVAVFGLTTAATPVANASAFNNNSYQSGFDNTLNNPGQQGLEGGND